MSLGVNGSPTGLFSGNIGRRCRVWRHTSELLKLCRRFGVGFKNPPGGEGAASENIGALSAIGIGFSPAPPSFTGLPQGDRTPVLAVGRV